jgi:two-component system LytT family response regulator
VTNPPAQDPIRVLIVDDEPLSVEALRAALEREADVEIVGWCNSGPDAVEAIRDLDPDLVFLDIQMPGMDGFGVINEVGADAMPAVVFVTAFDQHALRAFEVHALDYLVKPFDDERFAVCLRHAADQVRRLRAGEREDMLGTALKSLTQPGALQVPVRRLLVRERDRLQFVDVARVDWFEAAGNYVRLYTGDKTHLVRMAIADLTELLDPRDFARIHRSTIVNIHRVREVQPWSGGDYLAILHDGRELKVSRTYREGFLRPFA